MKNLIIGVTILLTIAACKKDKNQPFVDRGCGCGSDSIVQVVRELDGQLIYNHTANRWSLSHLTIGGFWYDFYVCNTNQDSISKILKSTSTSTTINVNFSGRAVKTCPEENFGFQTGNGVNYNFYVDSVRRR